MTTPFWKNKKILITGHTGFKGGWLSIWLHQLGAELHGIALDPLTEPNLFTIANIASLFVSDHRVDIRDQQRILSLIQSIQPDVVFHLAAQPLVQDSYDMPVETYAINVMGTAHVLDAIRQCPTVRAAVIVTTDKCYENVERIEPYQENDRLGGLDPYSSSKACAELVASAYRKSYFERAGHLHMATARAGNVIGGGDWAAHRLIPDCIRAYCAKLPMTLRYPQAVRPWQHVLESVQGYLLLAEQLYGPQGPAFAEAWNFGPEMSDMQTVGEVANRVCQQLNIPIDMPNVTPKRHESKLLRLDSTKAKTRLQWHPRWHLSEAIDATVAWYQAWLNQSEMLAFTQSQIKAYQQTTISLTNLVAG